MGLLGQFREAESKNKKKDSYSPEADFDVLYSTGFLSIDYLNGTKVFVESEERNFSYVAGGIVDGSCNAFIGRSGSGKSTICTQIAGNIIRPFIKKNMPTGLFIDDIEGSLPMARKQFLLGLSEKEIEDYVVMRNYGITTENVYERFRWIRDEKINHRKTYEYDTGLYDIHGNRVIKLVPTVYIIDSLPNLLPKEILEEEELGGNMDSSSVAKKNTFLLKKIVQLAKEANIILLSVNHIMDDIQMGFIPKAAQISGLKQGERLPGGRAAIQVSNNMFRTDDKLTLKPTEGFGIDGSVVDLTLIKSRTNASKRSVPLIFNKSEGNFDPILSLFQLLKSEGAFSGAGSYLYLDGMDDIKFSQKSFKETLEGSPELQKVFAQSCYNVLYPYLATTKNMDENVSKSSSNIIDLVNQMSNGQ